MNEAPKVQDWSLLRTAMNFPWRGGGGKEEQLLIIAVPPPKRGLEPASGAVKASSPKGI